MIGGFTGVVLLVFLLLLKLLSSNDSDRATIVNTGHTGLDGPNADQEIIIKYRAAKELMQQGKLNESEEAFMRLFINTKVEEPTRSWAGLDGVVAAFLDGRMNDAKRHAKSVTEHIDTRSSKLPPGFSNVLNPTLKSVQHLEFQDIKKMDLSKMDDEHLMACMIAGLKNWEQGGLDKAAPFFETITREIDANHNGPLAWYRNVADHYLSDLLVLKSKPMKDIPSTSSDCRSAVDELEVALGSLKTRGRAKYNIRSRQSELRQHETYLDSQLNAN